MASQKAAVRHKVEPARLDMSQVWSKAQAVIQVCLAPNQAEGVQNLGNMYLHRTPRKYGP
jgi:hypothetical protein